MTAAVGLSPKVETNEVQHKASKVASLYDAWTKRRFFRGGRRFGFLVRFGLAFGRMICRAMRAHGRIFSLRLPSCQLTIQKYEYYASYC